MEFKTIEWVDDKVIMLDQTKLPHEEIYVEYSDYREVAAAIKDLVIRGAPAIGVACAMGIALGAQGINAADREAFLEQLEEICNTMAATRPTAVNLFWAIKRMQGRCRECQSESPEELRKILREEALAIREEDRQRCRKMGDHGKVLIKNRSSILTHCNAGALATAGIGTALGVIRAAWDEGKELHVFSDETRPILQGARLTAWELQKDNIPVTQITDNMAGYLMAEGRIDLVIVGADRIAANGDVANKIGTYSVALLAWIHKIPFYVAAPLSTIDFSLSSGKEIPIEQRAPQEVTHVLGRPISPAGIEAVNPAFDVTPHQYVTAIVTDYGVARESYNESLSRMAEEERA